LHIVHIYVIEPHPEGDPSPYGGIRENEFSPGHPQARTYEERVAYARETLPLLTGDQLLLVDELTPLRDNPLWCTYGTCPNCAFLIGQDGILREVETWYNPSDMERAVDALLAE
jgi:hypothetical protein